MSRHTKARVTHTRRFQLFLRVLSVLGALGILFCVICINHTDVALGWIIRVAVSRPGYGNMCKLLTCNSQALRFFTTSMQSIILPDRPLAGLRGLRPATIYSHLSWTVV
jgi:hypothetical protein